MKELKIDNKLFSKISLNYFAFSEKRITFAIQELRMILDKKNRL